MSEADDDSGGTVIGLSWETELLILVVLIGSLGGLIALLRIAGENTMRAKQFAVGLGIAVFLPLSSHFGAELVVPLPNYERLMEERQRLENQLITDKSAATKLRVTQTIQAQQREYDAKKKEHDKMLFLVGYPVGVAAIILGIFLAVQHVGAGLLFGGIFTLADACFNYWEAMPAWLRFAAVLGALILLAVLGYWRLGPRYAPPEPAQPLPAV